VGLKRARNNVLRSLGEAENEESWLPDKTPRGEEIRFLPIQKELFE